MRIECASWREPSKHRLVCRKPRKFAEAHGSRCPSLPRLLLLGCRLRVSRCQWLWRDRRSSCTCYDGGFSSFALSLDLAQLGNRWRPFSDSSSLSTMSKLFHWHQTAAPDLPLARFSSPSLTDYCRDVALQRRADCSFSSACCASASMSDSLNWRRLQSHDVWRSPSSSCHSN